MFENPIRAIPHVVVGTSSGISAAVKKGKDKVAKIPIFRKKGKSSKVRQSIWMMVGKAIMMRSCS